jgi:hypothetical protein
MNAHGNTQRDRTGSDSPAADPQAPGHDEWLIDEALAETFPASDPPAPAQPGSTVGSHYAARARDAGRIGTEPLKALLPVLRSPPGWLLIGGAVFLVALLGAARRR